jgi:hypothetical protein
LPNNSNGKKKYSFFSLNLEGLNPATWIGPYRKTQNIKQPMKFFQLSRIEAQPIQKKKNQP